MSLLQVNLFPLRGNSMKPRELIASLNNNKSFISAPGLFLSVGFSNEVEIPHN
jgi:hypothetical protein